MNWIETLRSVFTELALIWLSEWPLEALVYNLPSGAGFAIQLATVFKNAFTIVFLLAHFSLVTAAATQLVAAIAGVWVLAAQAPFRALYHVGVALLAKVGRVQLIDEVLLGWDSVVPVALRFHHDRARHRSSDLQRLVGVVVEIVVSCCDCGLIGEFVLEILTGELLVGGIVRVRVSLGGALIWIVACVWLVIAIARRWVWVLF